MYDPDLSADSNQLKTTKAIISHQWNTILSVGCIFVAGVWVLFMVTVYIFERMF